MKNDDTNRLSRKWKRIIKDFLKIKKILIDVKTKIKKSIIPKEGGIKVIP